MRIRTITADTMAEALKIIRTQLGPEALILNTRKVKTKSGADTLEITAALNEADEISYAKASETKASSQIGSALQSSESKNSHQPRLGEKSPGLRSFSAEDPGLRSFSAEDPGLRSFSGADTPLPSLTASTLAAHDLPQDLITTLQTALPGLEAAGFTTAEGVAMLLGKQLKFLSAQEALPMGAAHVFVGPHGAGKTTLVAKLALQAKQQGRTLGLLSLDDQKIGGFEPLAIAAEIFGDAAHLITNRTDLQSAATKLGNRQALLLDTAGFNPFAPKGLATLQQRLEELGIPLQVHLVIPANLNAHDMATLPIACQRLNPQSLIFTKLDCTTRYGALVATAAQSGLPLGLATHAADMATPPLNLSSTWLAEALLQLPQQPWEFAA